MSLSNYNPHTRYKQRAAQRFTSVLGMMALMLVSILIGFWLGKQYGATQLIQLKEQVTSLTDERDALEEKSTELTAAAQTAAKRYEQLQEEVASVIPEGPMQNLVTLVREQIEKGTDPERLSFVIRSARPPTGCVDPDSKRFVVATAANSAPKSVASIADDQIFVSGSGASARNEKGAPEAWYDPTKRVEVTFKHGEKIDKKRGVLPIRYSTVIGDREYRLTVEAGSKSFAKVVYDSCSYP